MFQDFYMKHENCLPHCHKRELIDGMKAKLRTFTTCKGHNCNIKEQCGFWNKIVHITPEEVFGINK